MNLTWVSTFPLIDYFTENWKDGSSVLMLNLRLQCPAGHKQIP